jgi:hypothetical protein
MGTIIKVDVSLRKEVLSNTTTVVVVAIALMETRYIFL